MRIKKIGQAYVMIDKMGQNKQIPQEILERLERNPSWYFTTENLNSPIFTEYFRYIIESNCKFISFFN